MKSILKSSFAIWAIIFLVLNFASRGNGNTNERSRLALMRAMVEQQSFSIDTYKDWTIDWAQTPDGHYYSNKAPGPMFLGLPFFFVMEKITQFDKKETHDSNGYRTKEVGPTPRALLAITHQALPYAILVTMLVTFFVAQGLPLLYAHLLTAGLFFGHTAAIFMNTYFGHGMAAMLCLTFIFCMIKRKFKSSGLALGLLVLSDYGAAMIVLPAGILLLQLKNNWRSIRDFILGATLPALIWCWYHAMSFGGILNIASKFQNPEFIDVAEKTSLWGIFSFSIKPSVVYELLFGPTRGVLFTQPWALLSFIVFPIYLKNKNREQTITAISTFTMISFLMLLMMNITFGAWHAGHSSGPRYLSLIFPSLLVISVLMLNELRIKWLTFLFGLTLLFAIAVRGLIFASSITAHIEPLLTWLYNDMMAQANDAGVRKLIFYFALLIAGVLFACYKDFRKVRS